MPALAGPAEVGAGHRQGGHLAIQLQCSAERLEKPAEWFDANIMSQQAPLPVSTMSEHATALQKHVQGFMEAGGLKLQLERRVKAFWPSSCQAADRSLVESTSPESSKPSKSRPLRSLLLRRSERHAR